ncbi:MAG: DAK2 domain-containing protein [Candidatus Omnitrophota bacterium]
MKNISYCSGLRLKASIISGINWFSLFKNEVDAINVFPVPDSDTGKNMYQTFSSILEYLKKANWRSASDVAEKAALGAVMGARGCSGVILSGFFRGFAEAIGNKIWLSGRDLALCFKSASDKAYQTVVKPKEGTILTVAKDMANVCLKATKRDGSLKTVMKTAYGAAQKSLKATPKKLKILSRYKVVDSGGQGLVYFLEGMERYNFGRSIKKAAKGKVFLIRPTFKIEVPIPNKFCTEFILRSNKLRRESLEDILTKLGDSLIISQIQGFQGGVMIYKIHIHSKEPRQILNRLSKVGVVSEIKVDDMQHQHLEAKGL